MSVQQHFTNDSSLIIARNRAVSVDSISDNDEITFVIIADPQLGLYERYIEKRQPPFKWDLESNIIRRTVIVLNQLNPKPQFVILCGDLIDAQPGCPQRNEQMEDLISLFNELNRSIPLIVLPGNHDIGESPCSDDIKYYTCTWGDDYYSFIINPIRFLVLNSQYFYDDSKCANESQQFQLWLEEKLKTDSVEFKTTVVLQHIPFYVNEPDECDGYFNIPNKIRHKLLHKFSESQISHVFSGHLHRNQVNTWINPKLPNPEPLQLITTCALTVQLAQGENPGIRLVKFTKSNLTMKHKYWDLNALEELISNNIHSYYSF